MEKNKREMVGDYNQGNKVREIERKKKREGQKQRVEKRERERGIEAKREVWKKERE